LRMSVVGANRTSSDVRYPVADGVPAQPVDATQALNLSAGVSNCKVSRGRSIEQPTTFQFVVNLNAAKTLSLNLPPNDTRVCRRGDRVSAATSGSGTNQRFEVGIRSAWRWVSRRRVRALSPKPREAGKPSKNWCCQTGLNCRPLHYQWRSLVSRISRNNKHLGLFALRCCESFQSASAERRKVSSVAKPVPIRGRVRI